MSLEAIVVLVVTLSERIGAQAIVSMSTDVYLVSSSPKGGSSFSSTGMIRILMTYKSGTHVMPRTRAKRFFTLSKTFVAEEVSRVRGIYLGSLFSEVHLSLSHFCCHRRSILPSNFTCTNAFKVVPISLEVQYWCLIQKHTNLSLVAATLATDWPVSLLEQNNLEN